MIIKGYIFTYLYIFFIILISLILNKSFKVKETLTRKFIHISVSFCWVLFFIFFKKTIHIVILPVTLVIFNYLSYKKSFIKSMNNETKSLGTVYYALSIAIMGLITYFYPKYYFSFGIGVFSMALGDGFAPILGKYISRKKIFKDKTLGGFFVVMVFTFLTMLVFNRIFILDYSFIKMVIIGFFAALLELFANNGTDNLSLPLGVSLSVYLLGVI